MNTFVRIPNFPDYSISPQGEVRAERSGLLLKHDSRGRVRFRAGNGRPLFHVGELLIMAGLMPSPVPLSDLKKAAGNPPSLEFLLDAAKDAPARLALARRANGHLLSLVKTLRTRIETLENAVATAKSKKPRPKPKGEP